MAMTFALGRSGGEVPVFDVDMSEDDFQILVDYYKNLPVIPGEMPLEWWYAVCGKNDDLREYLTKKQEQEAAMLAVYNLDEGEPAGSDETQPVEPAETQPAEPAETQPVEPVVTQVTTTENTEGTSVSSAPETPAETGASVQSTESDTGSIPAVVSFFSLEEGSVSEPVTLLGAEADEGDPEAQATDPLPQPTISTDFEFVAFTKTEASTLPNTEIVIALQNAGVSYLDLSKANYTNATGDVTLTFGGLGTNENPFRGKITTPSEETTYSFYLNRALFGGISTEASFSNLQLVSKFEAADGNLLADYVTGEAGTTASWTVELGAPTGTDTTYILPSLIGKMTDSAVVNLTVNDNSGLDAKGTAFVCAEMNGSASLTVSLSALPKFIPTSGSAGVLVGKMSSTSSLTFTATGNVTIQAQSDTSTVDNTVLGGLVGEMQGSSHLTVSSSPITINLDNQKGSTGGLVGKLDGATLEVSTPILIELVKGKEMAGGLVAEAIDPIFSFAEGVTISGAGTNPLITKYNAGGPSGGIAGKLKVTQNLALSTDLVSIPVSETGTKQRSSLVEVSGISITYGDCGGLFGEVYNDGKSLTLTNPKVTNLTLEGRSTDGNNGGVCGGLIGWYNPSNANSTQKTSNLTVTGANVTVTSGTKAKAIGGLIGLAVGGHVIKLSGTAAIAPGNCNRFGGAVGSLEDENAYLQLENLTVTINSHANISDIQYFGGLLGTDGSPTATKTDPHNALVYIGDSVTLSMPAIYGKTAAGGLVGKMDYGALYLKSNPINGRSFNFDSSAANPYRGWVIGYRDNVLVCSETAWTPVTEETSKNANDTGKWGQVLDLTQFPGLIVMSTEDHELTINDLTRTTTEDGYYSYTVGTITPLTVFAKVALRVQLNPAGRMKIDNDVTTNDKVKIVLNADISLSGTGLNALTRDVDADYQDKLSIFIDGSGHTITLDNTPTYIGNVSHDRQGLICVVKALTMQNLTFEGSPIVRVVHNGGDMQCGVVCSQREEACTLNNVVSSVQWDIEAIGGITNSPITAGFICKLVTVNDKDVSFTDCTWDGSITNTIPTDRYCGGFVALVENTKPKLSFADCTVSGEIEYVGSTDYARVGGLVASQTNTAATMTITNLTVEGTTIKTTNSTRSGGLLGYEWLCKTVTIKGISIKDSSLDAGTAGFGGLVYRGSGYWSVKAGTKTTGTDEGVNDTVIYSGGISISGTSFTGGTSNDIPSGLLVCLGSRLDDSSSNSANIKKETALYLEVEDIETAYRLNEINLTLNGSGSYFDELVGKSMDSSGNGIVSIATDSSHSLIDQTTKRNTYEHQLTNDYDNPQTRYYYNLDAYRTDYNNADGINTPVEMVLLSAKGHCSDDLDGYFPVNYGTITGNISLKGYSYYPIAYNSGISISSATIEFDFGTLETMESANTDTGLAENKTPSNPSRQHAQMHTGLFTSVSASGSAVTFSINGLTLKGNVGSYNGQSGAIIRETAQGSSSINLLTLDFSGITLDGISIYGYDTSAESKPVRPLLVNSIGSYSSLSLSNVTTVSDSYAEISKAASSLIGQVGSADAEFINLTFSNMRLNQDGNKDANCTLFQNALFLESFTYSSQTCSGVYNFIQVDDYTLGQELSNTESGAISGRNNGLQYWFFKDDQEENNYICELIPLTDVNPTTAFAEFTRYVHTVEDDLTQHELDINLLPADLLEGCGTYSHPYLIRNAAQLKAVAEMLRGTPRSGWQVKVDNAVLPSADFSLQNSHVDERADTTEAEALVEGEETIFSCDGGTWTRIQGDAEPGDMLAYLRSAYYVIEEPIDLGNGWVGLGEAAASQRFRGVIVGGTRGEVTIGASNSTQIGGLVKFSDGCVIKNLTITFTGAVNVIASSTENDVLSSPSFFGGVVGWCIGGDTIIDNVTVIANPSVTITANGADGWSPVAGGVVGLVGGASGVGGGGVVFRGSVSSLTLGITGNYCDPYVGRVLDGYAVSESSGDIGSGNQNYKIPSLPVEGTTFGILVDDSTIQVSDGNGLWILAAMENSRHGDAGKGRFCQYDTVGSPDCLTDLDDQLADEKAGASTNSRYLSQRCNGQSLPSSSSAISLEVTGNCDMTTFGSSFRGIGVSHGLIATSTNTGYDSESDWLKITSVIGNGNTITLAQSVNETAGEADLWSSMGAGLFPVIRFTENVDENNGTTIRNLNFSGRIDFQNGYTFAFATKNRFADAPGRVGVGMLAGRVLNSDVSATLTNVQLNSVTVNAPTAPFVGGLFGYCGTQINTANSYKIRPDALTFTNCSYSNLNVTGFTEVGGLVGFAGVETVTINGDSGFTGTSGTVKAMSENCYYYTGSNNQDYRDGVGGLIGFLDNGVLQASNIILNTLSVTSTADLGTSGKNCSDVGGLVGTWIGYSNAQGAISNITLTGKITISSQVYSGTTTKESYSAVGGLFGLISDVNLQTWSNTGGIINVSFNDLNIVSSQGSGTVSVTGGRAGGIVGVFKSGTDSNNNQLTLTNVHMGYDDNSITVSNNGGNWSGIGGLTGVLWCRPMVNASNITMKGVVINGGGKSAALVFGTRSDTDGVKINIKNVYAENCSVTSNGEHIGFLYGSTTNMTLYGYNILIKESSLSGNATKNVWGGTGKAYLVAVNAIACSGAKQEFGNNATTNYAIRANFTCAQDGTTFPYMPDSPTSNLRTLTIDGIPTPITGDGAAFQTGTTAPIAKIIEAGTYFNVATEISYFSTGDPEKWISNYLASTDSGLPDGTERKNFPVLVVPAKTESEVTEIILKYLAVLTNQTETWWENRLGSVTLRTFKWTDGAFVQQDTASLTNTGTGIRVTPGEYDNKRDQFTLLDAAFQDPTGTGEIFHLYVPIIVQKLLEFKFWASAMQGTNYNAGAYNALDSLAIGSHGEQFTVLIGYELQYSKVEWQTLVDNGEDLLWNFKKIIDIGNQSLPEGTKLTLVDRNNQSKAYFAQAAPAGAIDLEAVFTDWEPLYLCDYLKLSPTQSDTGTYVKTIEGDSERKLRIQTETGYEYYRLATSDDLPANRYNITVCLEEKLQETYFLTIQTTGGGLFNANLMCDDKLAYGGKGIPTRRIPNNNGLPYTRNRDENHLIIGDFLSQEFTVNAMTVPDNMSASADRTLEAELKMVINQNKDPNYQEYFSFFATNTTFYPQFDLHLNDGESDWPIPAGTMLEVTYELDGEPYGEPETRILDESSMVRLDGFLDGIHALKVDSDGLVLTAHITLIYDDAGIIEQFPARADASTTGIQVYGRAYLSYNQGIQSNAPENSSDTTHKYHRLETDTASLFFMAAVPDGEETSVNQLGINGLAGSSFGIATVAYYDVSKLKAASAADTLVCKLSFYPKMKNSTKYSTEAVPVPYTASYTVGLNGITLPQSNGPGISLQDNILNPDIPIKITIPLTISTGSGFIGLYSNYMVKLTVYLTNNGKEIAGSRDDDYIIYTNAKILTTLVQG
ncbi:MAG: hypothetical protein ACI3XG_10655 [Faecousia sp.]